MMKTFTTFIKLNRLAVKFLLMVFVILSLTISQKVQSQTYGPPLFTEDFGTVPTGQNVTTYRGDITGRGTIGNDFWLWPYNCPSGGGWMSEETGLPVLQTSYAASLPASPQGFTQWSFVPSQILPPP